MSFEEEKEFLKQFEQRAERGQMLDVHEIENAYRERVGHSISHDQIYRVLRRHGWRKIMPRGRLPKKASEEVIETSKKINPKYRPTAFKTMSMKVKFSKGRPGLKQL